jgi:hypothetical protein
MEWVVRVVATHRGTRVPQDLVELLILALLAVESVTHMITLVNQKAKLEQMLTLLELLQLMKFKILVEGVPKIIVMNQIRTHSPTWS